MKAKALEVRDRATFIPVLAVDMNPGTVRYCDAAGHCVSEGPDGSQRYLLRRAGYACDGKPIILLTRLHAKGAKACYSPYDWGDRTWHVAHLYIIEHWAELTDGDVVDVEFILGETQEKKLSERVADPYFHT